MYVSLARGMCLPVATQVYWAGIVVGRGQAVHRGCEGRRGSRGSFTPVRYPGNAVARLQALSVALSRVQVLLRGVAVDRRDSSWAKNGIR